MATRVLLADDEPALLASVERLLGQLGFDVIATAANGRQAVELTERLNPDVVVTDFRMPDLTGVEVAAHLHVTRPHLPVVILSAYNDEIQAAVERGPVAAYVVKGCSSRILGATIRAAVEV